MCKPNHDSEQKSSNEHQKITAWLPENIGMMHRQVLPYGLLASIAKHKAFLSFYPKFLFNFLIIYIRFVQQWFIIVILILPQ